MAVEDSNVLSQQWEQYRRSMFLSGKPGSGKTAVLLKCAGVKDTSPVVSCIFLAFVNVVSVVPYFHMLSLFPSFVPLLSGFMCCRRRARHEGALYLSYRCLGLCYPELAPRAGREL